MRTEKQLRQRKEELDQLLLLIEKYKIVVSQSTRTRLRSQVTNIGWLLGEEEEGESVVWGKK